MNVHISRTLSHGDFSVRGILPPTEGFGDCKFATFLFSKHVSVVVAPLSPYINFGVCSPRSSEISLESSARVRSRHQFAGNGHLYGVESLFTSLVSFLSVVFLTYVFC